MPANPLDIPNGASTANPLNIPSTGALAPVPFDATPMGIAKNTITGIPGVVKNMALDFSKDVVGTGMSIVNMVKTWMGQPIVTSFNPRAGLNVNGAFSKETTDNQDLVSQDLATRVSDTEQTIKNSPLAKKYGLDKHALPLAFGAVIGSTALDFTPFGGEENIAKELLSETTAKGALDILTKSSVPEQVAKEFAPRFAEATTPQDVSGLLDLMKGASGADNMARESTDIATRGPEVPSIAAKIPKVDPEAEAVQIGHVAQFTKALQDAQPLRAEQEALYTETRAQRIQALEEVQKTTSGQAGFAAEKTKLSGQMPKVQFESLRSAMNQDQIDSLFNMVRDSPNLDSFDTVTARNGLEKMFGLHGGSVPTEGEIKLLSRVFPDETIKALLSKRSILTKLGDGVINTLNIPRSIMSSFDLSAPFRQGIFMSGRKEFYQGFGQMFKDFGSEEAFKASQEDIFHRPSYSLMKDAKLAIMDDGATLSDREERFMSNYAERIPVAGRVVRASGRAYTGFLNKVRADVFDSLIKKAQDTGVPLTNSLVADLGKYINSATGRGSIGTLNRSAQVLNSVLFSPRLMMSRLNLLNPVYYARLDPFVRKEALKDLFRFTGMATTVLGLAAAGGAKVSLDATNADFGKMKIGDTRIDVLGGFQQYIRIAAQLLSGKITSSTTGKELSLGVGYKPLTRLDIIERFFQGKENPVASFITDWLQGQDLVGNKFKVGPELLSRVIPMITQDMFDVFKDGGFAKALGVTAVGVFGFGIQTYNQGAGNNKSNPLNI